MRYFFLFFFVVQSGMICFGQQGSPVTWTFHVEAVSSSQLDFKINASIAPGWHLYSQFLKDGGPIPTHISFASSKDYTLVGKPTEDGEPVKFHDKRFDMDIVWYSASAQFLQKIMLHRPVTTIKGRIEYMVCNDKLCIPDRYEFEVSPDPVKPRK